MKPLATLLTVAAFTAGMAWVESAVVFDLRTLVDRIEPYQANPLPLIGKLGPVELVRELATMVMILTVGILAGRDWRTRLGYSAIVFGLWDILYYAFLKVMCGWPHSLMDWDILFLLPLPWWGPVLAPMLIAGLMIVWGVIETQFEPAPASSRAGWFAGLAVAGGIGLALYVFMKDALASADKSADTLRNLLPQTFHWPLFIVALILLTVPILFRARDTGVPGLSLALCRVWFSRPQRSGLSHERIAQLD